MNHEQDVGLSVLLAIQLNEVASCCLLPAADLLCRIHM